MKKLIYIFILIASISKAQYAPVKVVSVTDTVTIGDTLDISYTYTCSAVMAKMQLWTSTYLQDCLYTNCSSLTGSHRVLITPNMGSGSARIYSNATPGGYKSFYIKSNDVGIYEHTSVNISQVKYYDIYGKEKASDCEGLLIRVTTYSNGCVKSDKVIRTQ